MRKSKAQRAFEIEERRLKVIGLYRRKATQTEIAKELGISLGTVNKDIQASRALFREARIDDVRQMIEDEAAELDEIERDCAARFAEDRNPAWLKLRLDAKARRAKMMGLDAPERRDVTSGGRPISGGPVVLEVLLELPEEEIDQRIACAQGDQAPEGLSG